MSALPLQRPRRSQVRCVLSHAQRRMMLHSFGDIDPQRIELGRASIGAASWCHMFGDLFGNPNAVLYRETARVIKFPATAGKKRDGRC